MAEEKLIKAVIARGRSYYAAGTGRKLLGIVDGKEVHGPATWRYVLPGESIELTESDVRIGRALGYLVDPNAVASPEPEGPTVTHQGEYKPGLVESRRH